MPRLAENPASSNISLAAFSSALGRALSLEPSSPKGLTPKRSKRMPPSAVGSNSAARRVPAPMSIVRKDLELILFQ